MVFWITPPSSREIGLCFRAAKTMRSTFVAAVCVMTLAVVARSAERACAQSFRRGGTRVQRRPAGDRARRKRRTRSSSSSFCTTARFRPTAATWWSPRRTRNWFRCGSCNSGRATSAGWRSRRSRASRSTRFSTAASRPATSRRPGPAATACCWKRGSSGPAISTTSIPCERPSTPPRRSAPITSTAVFQSYNPFSLKREPFLSRYTGSLDLPKGGVYGFITSSQDCSFLLVDGKPVASAPGYHGPMHWGFRGTPARRAACGRPAQVRVRSRRRRPQRHDGRRLGDRPDRPKAVAAGAHPARGLRCAADRPSRRRVPCRCGRPG